MITVAEKQKLDSVIKKIDWQDTNDPNRKALATKIVEMVRKDVYNQDLVRYIADVRSFNPGEEIQFGVVKGLTAHTIEPGAYAPRSFITKDVETLPKHRVTISLSLDLEQLRSGRYGTIADFRRLAAEKLLGKRNALLWTTLYGAITSSSTDGNYGTFASTDTTATKRSAINSALEYVDDNTNEGAQGIIGRYGSLSFLEDITTNYGDATLEQIQRGGYVPIYRGRPVLRLKSFKNEFNNEQISASHIMIPGRGTVKFGILNPGLEIFEKVDGTDTYAWVITFWETYGCLVLESWKDYHIAIS